MSMNHSRRHLLLTLAAAPVALGGMAGLSLAHPVRTKSVGLTLRWLSDEVFPSFPQCLDALQARRISEA